MSLANAQASAAWKDVVAKENKLRRSYYLTRFGSGAVPCKGDAGTYDPWNNDKVSPLNGIHRVLAIPDIAGHKSWNMFKQTGRLVTPKLEEDPVFLPQLSADEVSSSSRPGTVSRAHTASAPDLAAVLGSAADEETGLARTFSAAPRSSRSRRSLSTAASLRTVVEEAVRTEMGKVVGLSTSRPQVSQPTGGRRAPKSPKMHLVSTQRTDYVWHQKATQSCT
eukprot:gb/GFBE01006918.1/.p1 GENE.gb/GFBE01006918.1/~~gb/GFBE01006918.1/.p1  ORF type:complete len:222 (+),score=39.42 gb/GFBE01006918.1/:1-666(+)